MIDNQSENLAGELIRDFQYLFSRRGNWNTQWTQIAQVIFPMEWPLFQGNGQNQTQGDMRNQEIFDSTGLLALQRFGSILDSLLTPRDQLWHSLTTDDKILKKDKATRIWFEQVTNILFKERYSPHANFSSQNQGQYLSLGAYGTGALFIDDYAGMNGLRYKNVHLSELYLQENHQGVIDSVCRYFTLTARQAQQAFGGDLGDKVMSAVKTAPETPFLFLHWVKPRHDQQPDRKDHKGMEFASYYVSMDDQKIVKESGYRTFPYALSRYYQAPNESYGRSPAMDVLPALKTLNEMKKTMLKQGQRAVDPVYLAHDDGIIDGFNVTPGAINAGGISADGRALIQALQPGNVQAGKEFMDDERQLVNDTFLISLFQILTENPEMTATEVMERTREKGILIAPVIGRQQSEKLGPQIEREIDILSRQQMLPPMPPLLKSAQGEYKITYDSPITRTQKAEWSAGAQRSLEMSVQIAQATGDPSPLFYFNFDEIIPGNAGISGMPASWINDAKTVQKMKQAHAQQIQQQQAIQAAPAVAGVMKAKAALSGPGGGQQ